MDKKKLAVVHIVKNELSLSDKEYRDILQKAVGVRSAKDLDDEKFRKLMNYFVRSKHYKLNPHGLTLRQRMYIKNLAMDLEWDQEHLNNFLHKYYHKSNINYLTKSEATKVIAGLKNIIKKKKDQHND